MEVQKTFHYGAIPDFGIIIDDYMNLCRRNCKESNLWHGRFLPISLYIYIKEMLSKMGGYRVDSWPSTRILPQTTFVLLDQLIMDSINDKTKHNIIKQIEKNLYIYEKVNLYRKETPQWNKGVFVEKRVENTEFKSWCDRWQVIYDNNTKLRLKAIKNIILPYKKKFIDRLMNPHTDIGKEYMKKKMEELPW